MFQELLILLAINYLGIIIQKLFNLPLPGTIIGMIIFFILLCTGIIKEEKIQNICNYLIKIMIVLLVPPIVSLLENFHIIKGDLIKIIFLLVVTTGITMVVTGKTVEILIRMKEKKNGYKHTR